MKNQNERKNNIKRKLFIVKQEVYNKNIIVIDDSIVRGNTSKHIINELRLYGAKKIYFVSCSPQIKYKNLYGIDLPKQEDLIAYNRNEDEIAVELGADKVIYLDIEDLKSSLYVINSKIQNFELSVFNGKYIS
jgi:amidophosphoribosyltransferase